MNKIVLIIKREYLTRVKKKSFIIMTIVGPILMAALILAPMWINSLNTEEVKNIAVFDQNNYYKNVLSNNDLVKFTFINKTQRDSIKKDISKTDYFALLEVPDINKTTSVTMYSDKQAGMKVEKYIKRTLEDFTEKKNLEEKGISPADIASSKVMIDINTIVNGEKSSSTIKTVIGFIAAIIIYMFIFMYGSQVMRGVIEEKTSRIVEVIISSIKPFELMAGKIIGIAFVAITQFVLWGVLTAAIIFPLQSFIGSDTQTEQVTQLSSDMSKVSDQLPVSDSGLSAIFESVKSFNWFAMLAAFLFFFVGGYLLYASLFAAIGSAVDNETDTQQFILPVTIPLILAFVSAQAIIQDPGGSVAFWFSIIPFTSPIIMPIRVAFGAVGAFDMIIAVILLIGMFIGTIWFAAKIYRVGILMYGKKVSYKELWKWVRYK